MVRKTVINETKCAGKVAASCSFLYDVVSPHCFVVTTILAVIFPVCSSATQNLSHICDQAAVYAAQETGVPVSVLQAITLTETGRKRNGVIRPWPWTVNMEGEGVWFENEDDARAYVYKNYKRGARSFDVGCFQINYKWHGQEFASIEEMFDPNPNALYAANFLLQLFREKGDWSGAAGAYHSRTQKYAEKYEKRFNAFRAAVLSDNTTTPPVNSLATAVPSAQKQQEIRINNYPLLQENSDPRTLGSLVPLGAQRSMERLISVSAEDG